MSELLFLQALHYVGADESKWQFNIHRTYMTLTLQCLEGHRFDIDVDDSGAVELVLHRDFCTHGDEDDAYLHLRAADGNLVEAVRLAENLRRLLSGEPPLETPHARFGRLMHEYLANRDDWYSDEWSEEIMPIAEQCGLAEEVIYDPEAHGEIEDAEPGCEVWIWKEVGK